MERITLQIDAAQLLITDATAFFIPLGVETRGDLEASFCFRVADQVDHRYAVEQRTAPPVLGDETEHAMLNLIPLAGARGEVRDMNRELERRG